MQRSTRPTSSGGGRTSSCAPARRRQQLPLARRGLGRRNLAISGERGEPIERGRADRSARVSAVRQVYQPRAKTDLGWPGGRPRSPTRQSTRTLLLIAAARASAARLPAEQVRFPGGSPLAAAVSTGCGRCQRRRCRGRAPAGSGRAGRGGGGRSRCDRRGCPSAIPGIGNPPKGNRARTASSATSAAGIVHQRAGRGSTSNIAAAKSRTCSTSTAANPAGWNPVSQPSVGRKNASPAAAPSTNRCRQGRSCSAQVRTAAPTGARYQAVRGGMPAASRPPATSAASSQDHPGRHRPRRRRPAGAGPAGMSSPVAAAVVSVSVTASARTPPARSRVPPGARRTFDRSAGRRSGRRRRRRVSPAARERRAQSAVACRRPPRGRR